LNNTDNAERLDHPHQYTTRLLRYIASGAASVDELINSVAIQIACQEVLGFEPSA
jgi:hypothetical protein